MARLFVVATPLGNLGDLSPRAAEILRTVSVVACEDTRVTRKLLAHLDAHPRLLSVREENERKGAEEVLAVLAGGGDVAYCSDAGMPVVSDPGRALVEVVRGAGHEVSVIPGPSAVTTALAASGLPADRFHFAGFLPARPAERRRELETLRALRVTLVFFEAPHRAGEFLAEAAEILGPRRVAVCRELTKKHEEILASTLDEAAKREEWRGELTIVVAGAPEGEDRPDVPVEEWIRRELAAPDRPGRAKEIARAAAALYGISGSEAHRLVLRERDRVPSAR